MLIIFDLDDTLIDTSGCLTPLKLRAAFSAIMGVDPEVSVEAWSLLERLNQDAESAKEAFLEFAEILELGEEATEKGVEILYGDIGEDTPVFPLEDVVETLKELAEKYQLALVSIGEESQQRKKMEKAGIDSTIFSRIKISSDRDKKPHYEKILNELHALPKKVLVCGDRVHLDLVPAKELGCLTVQMRWGRGLKALTPAERRAVDFTITEFKQIKDVLTKL